MAELDADDIRAKISSIRTDFEEGEDEATIAGLNELEKMFDQFCEEVRNILRRMTTNLERIK